MPSTFFGLEIGSRALTANQLALNVVSNNTSNINTPGYSRQNVDFQETDPYTPPDFAHSKPGELGTGVSVAGINRIRDQFVDKRVWAANSQSGAITNLRDTLIRVENAYNEPGDSGLGQQITNLYNGFSDLSANPESGAIRSTVRNKAETLVNSFHAISTTLSEITPEINSKINVTVDAVNRIAGQIATLNKAISLSVATGDTPNDLLDKRGQLLDNLSAYVDVQVTDQKDAQTGKVNGKVSVNVGGYSLVQDDTANPLPKTVITINNTLGLTTPAGDTIPLRSGELYGLVKATTLLKGYQADLDTLAYNVVTATNQRHQLGYGLDGTTNNAFFGPLTTSQGAAASITLDSGVEADLNKIAAASAPTPPNPFAPGNGDNARALASLTSEQVIGNFSLNSYYNARVAAVGADSQTFQQEADNQAKVLTQLRNQQSSVSGVNLDEELTKMLQYQRAYQAAARVINTADAFLDTIINQLGR